MSKILTSILLLLNISAISQTEKLTPLEKYQLFTNIKDTSSWELGNDLIDSVFLVLIVSSEEDFQNDSLTYLNKLSSLNSDSVYLDTFEIIEENLFFSRGGSLVEMSETQKRKREKELIFNLIEIQDSISKHRQFPFSLIEKAFLHVRLTGKSGELNMKYNFKCHNFANIEIISKEISFNQNEE